MLADEFFLLVLGYAFQRTAMGLEERTLLRMLFCRHSVFSHLVASQRRAEDGTAPSFFSVRIPYAYEDKDEGWMYLKLGPRGYGLLTYLVVSGLWMADGEWWPVDRYPI